MIAAARAQCLLEYAPAITPRQDVGSGMLTVAAYQRERLVDTVDFAVFGQAEPQLVVFAHDQLLVERPELLQQPSRYHDARQGDDGFLLEEPLQYPAGRRWPVAGACSDSRITQGIHHRKPGVAPFAAGMALKRFKLDLQFRRQPGVIGIQKGDVLALRLAQRGIAYHGWLSAMRQPDHSDARRIMQSLQVSPGVGVRAIVRDYQFPVFERLGKNGFDRGRKEFQAIVGGNNDR